MGSGESGGGGVVRGCREDERDIEELDKKHLTLVGRRMRREGVVEARPLGSTK